MGYANIDTPNRSVKVWITYYTRRKDAKLRIVHTDLSVVYTYQNICTYMWAEKYSDTLEVYNGLVRS